MRILMEMPTVRTIAASMIPVRTAGIRRELRSESGDAAEAWAAGTGTEGTVTATRRAISPRPEVTR